jgi:hypothetical protein
MPQSNEKLILIGFTQIHNIITRGLSVSLMSIRWFSEGSLVGPINLEGLFKYIQALVSVLNSHHLTEDEIAFPYFRALLPEAPFDSLIQDHQRIVVIMDEVHQALEKGEGHQALDTVLEELESALSRLNALWHPHIQVEAEQIAEKADALITLEERRQLVGQMSEHGQKTGGPPFLTVPFMLFNLPPGERAVFSQAMPGELLENLVPVVWKPQWESMTPYLLE